jgi:adenylate cyclase
MSIQPPAEHSAHPTAKPISGAAVQEQLQRIVNSDVFASSARLCRFLTHIVTRTLEGDPASLKEFSIAMEVFDRKSDYDPNVDAIVRVEARRLRTKLKAYYDNVSDPVVIGLKPGSYVPFFRWAESETETQKGVEAKQSRATIAVLPFVNMSPEPEQEYFCDGISEEVINSLTRVNGLNVIARTSSFQFRGTAIDIREVGQRLGADLVIEGSVRKWGDQLRITAQGIDTTSGHHLWSETFRRKLVDVFAIQEEIASAVSGLLRMHIPPHSTSDRDLDAYALYLRGRFLLHQQTPESLTSARQCFRELVAAYPNYAPGYSGIAAANGLLSLFGVVSGREVYPEMKDCAERGYALDRESANTCAILASLRAWGEHRWAEAERLYVEAIRLEPAQAETHMYRGMALLCQAKVDEAEASLRRSMELNPLSAADCARMAYLHYVKGEADCAAEQLAKSFELDRDYAEARFYEGLLAFRESRYDFIADRFALSNAPLELGLLAAAHGRLGDKTAAAQSMERLRRRSETEYVTPLAEGLASVGMGEVDRAFERLSEATEHRTNFVNLLAVEPFFEPLRQDSRFVRLLKKLRLPHGTAEAARSAKSIR